MTISAVTATSVPTNATSDQHATPEAAPRPRARRRSLTETQKAELGRLYAETTTPLSEIKSRFGIADSSLYRMLQQRGITLRGKSARSETAAADTGVTRRSGRRATGTGAARRRATPRVNGVNRYRVSFMGARVIEAVDIQAAIRQAQKLGATEIMQIERTTASK